MHKNRVDIAIRNHRREHVPGEHSSSLSLRSHREAARLPEPHEGDRDPIEYLWPGVPLC